MRRRPGKRGLRSVVDLATAHKRKQLQEQYDTATWQKAWADEAQALLSEVRAYFARADSLTSEELQDCYEKHVRIEELQALCGQEWVRPSKEVFGTAEVDD